MGMDMNMGMGMDMSADSGAFVATNSSLARSYWYIIASVLGFTAILRIFQIAETRTRCVTLDPLCGRKNYDMESLSDYIQ